MLVNIKFLSLVTPAPLQVPWGQGLFYCSLFWTQRCKGTRQLHIWWCFHFLCSRDVRTRGTLVILCSTLVFNERIQCVKWLIPIVQVISDFPRARNRSHLLTHDVMGEAWSDDVRQTPFSLPPSHTDTETTCLGFLILRLQIIFYIWLASRCGWKYLHIIGIQKWEL